MASDRKTSRDVVDSCMLELMDAVDSNFSQEEEMKNKLRQTRTLTRPIIRVKPKEPNYEEEKEKIWNCKFCAKWFMTRSGLRRHQMVHVKINSPLPSTKNQAATKSASGKMQT